MKSSVFKVIVDPCLSFRRIGLEAKLFLMTQEGEKFKFGQELSRFGENYFRVDDLKVGDILCYHMIVAHSSFYLTNDDVRLMVVVSISEREIEFSPFFKTSKELLAYLAANK